MKSKIVGGVIGTAISTMGMAISTEQLEQIVSIICSITGVIIVIITSLVVPLIKKIKKAKEDGVVTKEEMEDIKDTIVDGIEDVKGQIEKGKK